VPTWSGFVYVAFAIDLYSRAIIGWSAAATKDVAFVESCLAMALWRRDHTDRPVPAGMIHHSDAGSQYTSIRFTETLALEGLSASIDSVGELRRTLCQRYVRCRRGPRDWPGYPVVLSACRGVCPRHSCRAACGLR
jgi:transposase InsO family protein